METADFSRARIDAMLDLSDPLAVLATRLPWDQIEAATASACERPVRSRLRATSAEATLRGVECSVLQPNRYTSLSCENSPLHEALHDAGCILERARRRALAPVLPHRA
mgnify:CR=1 FL=1